MHDLEPLLDVADIQGHSLRGFDTDALVLLGLKIGDPMLARAWLSALSFRVDSVETVHKYRLTRQFAPFRKPRTLLNIALSAHALQIMGIDISTIEDGFFLQPMGLNAGTLFDPTDPSGNAIEYKLGTTWSTTPDILFIIGGDEADSAVEFCDQLRAAASMASCTEIYYDLGGKLPEEKEHFGFRDGISQVGPRGRLSTQSDDYLTPRLISPSDPQSPFFAKPGQPLVWPGQFVFGYPTQLPATPLEPGPIGDSGASWMKNGSFLVFRRLRQDIAAFESFLEAQSQQLTTALGRAVSAEEVGALIVGRWRDGSPIILAPTHPDSAVAADAMLVNDFAFALGTQSISVIGDGGQIRVIPAQPDDHAGQRCPYFSHIRKVNPRDSPTDQGIAGRTLTSQVLRRGLPYGKLAASGVFDQQDRGLLFLAYQTSFKRQFNVLNTLWVNNSSAPEVTDEGHDLLISQNFGKDRVAALRDPSGNTTATLTAHSRWVIPTGGGFFFSPSISFLRSLSEL